MARGAWRVARGAWRVARGAWRVACGAWRVAYGATKSNNEIRAVFSRNFFECLQPEISSNCISGCRHSKKCLLNTVLI